MDLEKMTTPFVTFHGTSDRLCNVDGSRLLFKRADSKVINKAAHYRLLAAKLLVIRKCIKLIMVYCPVLGALSDGVFYSLFLPF